MYNSSNQDIDAEAYIAQTNVMYNNTNQDMHAEADIAQIEHYVS